MLCIFTGTRITLSQLQCVRDTASLVPRIQELGEVEEESLSLLLADVVV